MAISLRQFALLATCMWASPAAAAPPPLAAGTKVLRNVPYVADGHERQKLDLYLPAAGGGERPLVVWIHGGGWEGGSKENCPALGLLPHGYVVASLNYRLSQHAPFPAQIEDCKAAIRWLRTHAGEYGIDPARIGAWGASAGGHLVALLGTTGHLHEFDRGDNLNQSSRVQCVLDWFGPTDFLHWGAGSLVNVVDPKSPIVKLFGGPVRDREALARSASPVNFVQKDAPPFLIMHGDKDPLVPLQQSEELNTALKEAGVESALEILPGAGHGGGAFLSADHIKGMVDFFDRHLSKIPTASVPHP